ncbi:hypothetical protein PZA11_006744 [Diplocarpon coronariae]
MSISPMISAKYAAVVEQVYQKNQSLLVPRNKRVPDPRPAPDLLLVPFLSLNYICRYSPYFRAAFEATSKKKDIQKINLTTTEQAIFGIFLTRPYAQKPMNDNGNPLTCRELLDLWKFADTYMARLLQNDVMVALDKMRYDRKRIFYKVIFQGLYDGTYPGYQIRR